MKIFKILLVILIEIAILFLNPPVWGIANIIILLTWILWRLSSLVIKTVKRSVRYTYENRQEIGLSAKKATVFTGKAFSKTSQKISSYYHVSEEEISLYKKNYEQSIQILLSEYSALNEAVLRIPKTRVNATKLFDIETVLRNFSNNIKRLERDMEIVDDKEIIKLNDLFQTAFTQLSLIRENIRTLIDDNNQVEVSV